MAAKLARHRSTQPGSTQPGSTQSGPTQAGSTQPGSSTARIGAKPQHRSGVRPAVGTGLLAVAVITALGIVVLGVLR